MSVNGVQQDQQFYSKAKQYWEQVEPDIDGMLGGYADISSSDLNTSKRFLCDFFSPIQVIKYEHKTQPQQDDDKNLVHLETLFTDQVCQSSSSSSLYNPFMTIYSIHSHLYTSRKGP